MRSDQVAHSFFHLGLGNLQVWSLHNLSSKYLQAEHLFFNMCLLCLKLSPSTAVSNPPSHCSSGGQAGCSWISQSCPLPRLNRSSSLLLSSQGKCSRDDTYTGDPGLQPTGGPGCCHGTLLALAISPAWTPRTFLQHCSPTTSFVLLLT